MSKSLATIDHHDILNHIMKPDEFPLPKKCKAQFYRVLQAAKLMDNNPNPSTVVRLLQTKYNIGTSVARRDVALAQELFKSQHTFDWDYWNTWQISDLVDTLKRIKLYGADKDYIAAHKLLREIIGEKPANLEDPQRMEKNVYNIQLNGNVIDLSKLQQLNPDVIQAILSIMHNPIDDQQALELMNT